ncbi:ribonuclease H-like domain-containing protein [Tanacetum coccineum]|uniref:Ribonuclease H-like domain-containing protein n=1 Tax=Tanacetum coccineum TaxID=301880 RepID=A0ABQ5DM04_9ASTR
MVTRSKVGIVRKNPKYVCHVSISSSIPRLHIHALCDPNWQHAMLDEYNALISNGIDCDETFSPIVKQATIRKVLSLVFSCQCPIHQLDAKNAFLHGHLSETVYMHQPPGFVNPAHPHHVCLLQKSLYGLKQAPRAWFQRFASYATRVGFQHSRTNSSLFIFQQENDIAYLLICVDDIIVTASSSDLLKQIISSLHAEFSMTDLGPVNYFLGIYAQRTSSGLFLSHTNLVGSLQYLIFTHLELPYGVNQVCLYMHDPREPHLSAMKRILRYVCGTLDHRLHLYISPTSQLIAYSDADWIGCPTTRWSTSGYCVFLSDNLITWSSKRQHVTSRSNAEAEYRGVANAVAETAWVRNLLRELLVPLRTATLVYRDNVSAVYLSCNPVQHQRTKHIEIDILLSVTLLPLVTSVFYMFPRDISLQISSQKVFLHHCLQSFAPV